MTYEQLGTFLAVDARRARAAEVPTGRRDHALFLLLADTGLRPGEALALQWPDVSLADRTISVERAVSAGAVKATKTGESRRVDRLAAVRGAAGWHRSGTDERNVGENVVEGVDSDGAGGGSRTRDLLITNQLLCL